MAQTGKRLTILIIFLAIVGFMGLFLFTLLRPDPTCTDGKQNQNETNVDCGGVCGACDTTDQLSDIVITETAIVPNSTNIYDVLVKVQNPNTLYGASGFDYRMSLFGSNGEQVGGQVGASFILPGETKGIVLVGIETTDTPNDIAIDITNITWEPFVEFSQPELKFTRKEYTPVTSGTGFGDVYGILRNESAFDFRTIDIKIILRNRQGEVIALHATQMQSIKSGETRDFTLHFPNSFPGQVARVEAEAEADVFGNDNFMRLHIPSQSLQSR